MASNVILSDEDREKLVLFADNLFANKLSLTEFAKVKAESDDPIVMRPQFRCDIRNLGISLIVYQIKSGHWLRVLKTWLKDGGVGDLPEPSTIIEVCRICGFTGKADTWQHEPETGRTHTYVNTAQVIIPGTHANLIQITHHVPKEEDIGRRPS